MAKKTDDLTMVVIQTNAWILEFFKGLLLYCNRTIFSIMYINLHNSSPDCLAKILQNTPTIVFIIYLIFDLDHSETPDTMINGKQGVGQAASWVEFCALRVLF